MIRVALVGAGGMAATYRRVYARTPLARVTAIVESDPAIASAAADELGVDRRAIASTFPRALEDDVDAVVLSTPNHLHRSQAVAALGAGKHLLVQKPIANTVEGAEAILAAHQGRTVAGMYHSYLDNPVVHELRDAVAAGALGRVRQFYGRLAHRDAERWSDDALAGRPSWRSSATLTGGGCFIQLAVHYLHLAAWIAGTTSTWIDGSRAKVATPGIEGEDLATALVRYANGMRATIDTGWTYAGEELAIHGESTSASYLAQRWYRAPGTETFVERRAPALDDETNPFNGHRRFLEACAGLRAVDVPLRDGLERLIEVRDFYARSALLTAVS